MKLRIAATIAVLLPLVYILGKLFLGGTSGLSDDFVLPAYAIIVVFTFPSLVSRLVWKRDYIGPAAALTFLYYPVLYLMSVAAAHVIGTAGNWMTVFGI